MKLVVIDIRRIELLSIMAQSKMNLLVLALCFVITQCVALENLCHDVASGERLPLATDCSKFVVCLDKKVAEVGTCPRGLHFNRELGECDFQWRAGCASDITAFSADDCSCDCCAEICGDDLIDEVSTSNTPCDTSVGTETTKGSGSGSDDGVTAPTASTSATASTPSSPSTPSTPSTAPTPSEGNFIVPSICDNNRTDCVNQADNTILLIPGQCRRYITCVGGCAIVQDCPSNLQYQIDGNFCDYPWNVNCTSSDADNEDDSESTLAPTGPSGTTCDDPGVCRDQHDGVKFANPDTNGYLVCQCGCAIAMPCDEGLIFNETLQVCDWDWSLVDSDSSSHNIVCPDGLIYNATIDQCDYPPDYVPQVNCTSTSTICDNQTDGKLFAYEGACNKFYKCSFNCAVEQLCPNNLVYDAEKEICDYPQNVACSWPYTPPSGPIAGPSGTSCESGGRCVGQNEGTLLPSETDCGQYIVCQCECEVPMTCAGDLYWDQELKTCNYRKDVVCKL